MKARAARCAYTVRLIITIIINIFLKRKLLSLETILSAHSHARAHARTHAHTHTHKHSGYTKLNVHSLKRAANARETWNG